jgi:hypothetical protein
LGADEGTGGWWGAGKRNFCGWPLRSRTRAAVLARCALTSPTKHTAVFSQGAWAAPSPLRFATRLTPIPGFGTRAARVPHPRLTPSPPGAPTPGRQPDGLNWKPSPSVAMSARTNGCGSRARDVRLVGRGRTNPWRHPRPRAEPPRTSPSEKTLTLARKSADPAPTRRTANCSLFKRRGAAVIKNARSSSRSPRPDVPDKTYGCFLPGGAAPLLDASLRYASHLPSGFAFVASLLVSPPLRGSAPGAPAPFTSKSQGSLRDLRQEREELAREWVRIKSARRAAREATQPTLRVTHAHVRNHPERHRARRR